MERGRRVLEGEGGAPVTVYLARRIARECKLAGGKKPATMFVAPEVFRLLVDWSQLRAGFEKLVRGMAGDAAAWPEFVVFDGIEIYPSETARMPWRIEHVLVTGP